MFDKPRPKASPSPESELHVPTVTFFTLTPESRRRIPAFCRSTILTLFRHELCSGNQPLARPLEIVDDRYISLSLNPPAAFGRVEFLRISDAAQLFAFKGKLRRSHVLPYLGHGWLHFCITVKGGMRFKLADGAHARSQPASALLLAYPEDGVCRDMFVKGESSIVSLFIRKSALLELMGVDENHAPEQLQQFLHASSPAGIIARQALGKELEELALKVFDNSIPTALKPFYLSGMAAELVVRFFADLWAVRMDGPEGHTALNSRTRAALWRAREIIDDDMMATIGLTELARRVGLNRSKLSQTFHAHFGITIQEYSIRQKMRYAEDYIKRRKGTLSELAGILGYSHPNSLSAAVKKYFGVPPRELAKL